jgi:tetratricopeptide (TPR) repeat protein
MSATQPAFRQAFRFASFATLAITGLCPLGCAYRRGGHVDLAAHRGDRPDTTWAIDLNRQGLDAKDDLDKAEKLFRQATEADVFYGPAHNNLGIVYFQQGRYYQAAWQFQHAAKLMPKATHPLVNLGLVFETVGRLDDAAAEYDKALTLTPDDVAAAQCLARLLVRTGQDRERVIQLLEDLSLRSEDPQWQAWSQLTLARVQKQTN